jgi:hypothetical protein
MAQSTQKYSRSLSGSIGAGMKSLLGGEGRRFYILEHKVSSKYHKAGESQRIIVDQIELGRDSKCQVRFDETFDTVSRRHAAIVKEGDNWKLVQLSQTNSTFLNGHKVAKEWYLQNGDEIQLSTNGPRMGFIVPEGNSGLVKSIGLTARMNLFRQQALRPYKQAIAALACVLVLCLAGGFWWAKHVDGLLKEKGQQIASLIDLNSNNQQVADSLANELQATNIKMKDYEKKISQMADETAKAKEQAHKAMDAAARAASQANPNGAAPGALKDQCFPYTYAIYQVKEVIKYPNGQVETDTNARLVGSGFLLSDGRFVTARHVTETYYFYHFNWGSEEFTSMLRLQNAIVHNGGDIETTFIAISHSGDRIQFTNKQCKVDRSGDKTNTATLENGMTVVLKNFNVSTADWVTIQTGKAGLPFDNGMSVSLPVGTNLQILGFPRGRGGEDPRAVSPISSHAEVARDGLDTDGTIMTSNDDTQSGNSGGPVFMLEDGKYTVVGILSGSTAGKGRIVPIKNAR